MFCNNCGVNLTDSAAYCPNCGRAVSRETESEGMPAPAPAGSFQIPKTYAVPEQTDGKAVASLVCGILAIFPLGLLAGIPAIILGHLSKSEIRRSLGKLKGEGMALAGLIMGYISLAFIPVILIIAAIAIPNLLRARMAANESAAAATLRTINTAQVSYSITYPKQGYASDLARLGPGASEDCSSPDEKHACLVDAIVANARCAAGVWCEKGSYKFTLSPLCEEKSPCTDYVALATPVSSATGSQSFCSTSDAVVRFHRGAPVSEPTMSVEECKLWSPLL